MGQKRGAVIHRLKLKGEIKTQIKKRKGGKIYRTKMGSSDSQIKIGRRKKNTNQKTERRKDF